MFCKQGSKGKVGQHVKGKTDSYEVHGTEGALPYSPEGKIK